jgi:hypothetical protein
MTCATAVLTDRAAEKVILRGIMQWEGLTTVVTRTGIDASDFYYWEHMKLFSASMFLANGGIHPSCFSLYQDMTRNGKELNIEWDNHKRLACYIAEVFTVKNHFEAMDFWCQQFVEEQLEPWCEHAPPLWCYTPLVTLGACAKVKDLAARRLKIYRAQEEIRDLLSPTDPHEW